MVRDPDQIPGSPRSWAAMQCSTFSSLWNMRTNVEVHLGQDELLAQADAWPAVGFPKQHDTEPSAIAPSDVPWGREISRNHIAGHDSVNGCSEWFGHLAIWGNTDGKQLAPMCSGTVFPTTLHLLEFTRQPGFHAGLARICNFFDIILPSWRRLLSSPNSALAHGLWKWSSGTRDPRETEELVWTIFRVSIGPRIRLCGSPRVRDRSDAATAAPGRLQDREDAVGFGPFPVVFSRFVLWAQSVRAMGFALCSVPCPLFDPIGGRRASAWVHLSAAWVLSNTKLPRVPSMDPHLHHPLVQTRSCSPRPGPGRSRSSPRPPDPAPFH